jgi:hypothetical protein
MIRKWTLSPLSVFGVAVFMFAGELLAGTNLYFASMASLAVLCVCVTYNVLNGLGSASGIAFTRFALSTLVIAQVGKVLVLERADKNLDTPNVVISVYALFFFSLMVGTMVFSRLRVPLPKPAEPETPTQSRYLYVVTFIGGLAGMALGWLAWWRGEAGATSLAHGVSLILSKLLSFSILLAVDHRIRSTDGRQFFGWMALWPTLVMEVNGFLWASRQGFVEPIAVIFLTCYLRNFSFRKRHMAIAAGLAAIFFAYVSPFYLYSRTGRTSPTAGELASTMIETLRMAPSQWSTIKYQVSSEVVGNTNSVSYFSSPSAVTLNRFALIGPDSTLISVCATGFHYGFTSLKLDLLSEIPRILYRDKPAIGSEQYLGQLDGQEIGSEGGTTYSTITMIADSYGAFNWAGLAISGFLVIPAIFVVYESMFDTRKPWGTLAMVTLLIGLTEGSIGHMLISLVIKAPVYILALSWVSMWIVRMIPASGDRHVAAKTLRGAATLTESDA